MDKGKSDSFARLIAIAQTLLAGGQMIVTCEPASESRSSKSHGSFCQLCITLYTLNWHKPKVWVYVDIVVVC